MANKLIKSIRGLLRYVRVMRKTDGKQADQVNKEITKVGQSNEKD